MKQPKNDLGDSFPNLGSMDSGDGFVWVNEISDDSLSSFYTDFTKLEEDPSLPIIPIIISSYGGELCTLIAMRDMIKSSPKKVATIALGKAFSAGACLLAAGTKGFRFASKDSLIMIHEASSQMSGKTSDLSESANFMKEMNTKVLSNLAADCGQSLATIEGIIRSKNNADWTLSADHAKKLGLIDKIAIPRLLHNPPHTSMVLTVPFAEQNAKAKKRKS